MRFSKYCFLLTALLAGFYSSAQNSLRFGRIPGDKLTQSTVYCTYQDSQGFIWFGTEDGLNKYDGYSFDVYKFDPTDSVSISNNIIRVMFEDSRHTLWIGTDNGLNTYNRKNGSFHRFQNSSSNPKSISNNLISSITEDKNGIVWIGTNNGLNAFDPKTSSFTAYHSNPSDVTTLSSNVISSLAISSTGTLWVGTAADGLNQFDVNSHKVIRYRHTSEPNSLNEDEITSLYFDHAGNLWIGTLNGGANKFSNGTFHHYTTEQGLSGNSVFSLAEDRSGQIWIATFGTGLNVLDPHSGKVSVYKRDPQNPESISSNRIYQIFQDNAGTIWFSTANGISFYNRTIAKFTTYRLSDSGEGASNNSVFAVCESKDDNVWVGILGSGLNVFSRREGRFINEQFSGLNNPALRYNNIFSIIEDRTGLLWIGTSDGLICYNRSNNQVSAYKHSDAPGSISNNYVRCVFEDKNGTIWVGTYGGGLNMYDRTSGKFTVFKNIAGSEGSLSSDVVMDIYEDRGGKLWICTYGGGLNSFDKSSHTFKVFKNETSNPKSISSNFVNCIHEDKNGKLLVGTYGGGLNVLDPSGNEFMHFIESNGLPSNIINGIISDRKGNIWISTNNGVCKLNLTSDPKSMTTNSRTYNAKDGLQNKLNENACFSGADGWLYFGGSNGLNAFHPDSINDNTVIPPVVITRFYLFEKPSRMDTLITSDQKLNLSYRQNFFSFDFAALNYLFPEKNRYAYKMEGLNDDWIYSGERHFVQYTNIDPGTYTFRVKACNNDGVWNEQGIAIEITIQPPFWKTWWFTALFALFVTVVIFAYIRIRTNTLVKQNLVLEEKVNSRTAELQEKNIQLTKTMDNLKSTQDQLIQSEKMASLGQLTAGIAHEIQNPLNFVNNFSELSVELIEELKDEQLPKEEQGEIIEDLKQNMEKINYHGKRADSIVKGMLQHSRISAAEKTPTDINKLVEEFFNLAYHGMRAKDPSFNCTMEKNLSPNLPPARIIPQDISRVILNIFNNAFYAVDERGKAEGKNFQPVVSITTSSSNNNIEIRIKDNGKGIPAEIRDKIFNPFFTTKPTGQGTGLGLSISYDIVVKGHGGSIRAESEMGKFTEFVIILPA